MNNVTMAQLIEFGLLTEDQRVKVPDGIGGFDNKKYEALESKDFDKIENWIEYHKKDNENANKMWEDYIKEFLRAKKLIAKAGEDEPELFILTNTEVGAEELLQLLFDYTKKILG